MSYYFWILLGTMVFPLVLSFDRKIHFYKRWKFLFPAVLLVGILFIGWDSYFTSKEVWGFNPEYIQGIYFLHLPLEEILFFLFVPYACLFVYDVLNGYFPQFSGILLGRAFAFGMVLSGLILAIVYMRHWYTLTACTSASLLIIGIHFRARKAWFNRFVLMYLVCLIPFLLVNGALTGFFTAEPVVWYAEQHISGFRVGTIPIEDFFYNLSMLLSITALYEWLKGKN